MFFRRKKQPDADQTVLTETLRSLEDLIAETPEPVPADSVQQSTACALPEAGDENHQAREDGPATPQGSDVTAENQMPDNTFDDEVPLLTNVVYMPIPRVTPTATTFATPSSSIDSAQRTIAQTLVHTVENSLDTNGQPLDPELAQDLQDAVSASLEDWSTRTQEILLKRFSPPTKK